MATRAPTLSHDSRERSAWRSRVKIVDGAICLEVVLTSAVDETQLVAWQSLECGIELVVPLSIRCSQASKLVPQGTLVRCMQFGIHAGEMLVGCAELLLVRKPPDVPSALCRICLDDAEEGSFDNDETLNQAVLAALTGGGDGGGTASQVARGSLLRDACSCRGSAGAVHEGCLASWLIASGKWGEHVCGECLQPS